MALAQEPFLSLWAQAMNVLHWHLFCSCISEYTRTFKKWMHIWGFRYKLHSKFVLISYFNAKEGNLWLYKMCHLFKKFSFTNWLFFIKECDFSGRGTLQKMFCSFYFHHFNLVMITEKRFGFDRFGYFPLFANSNIFPNHPSDVENKTISVLVIMRDG